MIIEKNGFTRNIDESQLSNYEAKGYKKLVKEKAPEKVAAKAPEKAPEKVEPIKE